MSTTVVPVPVAAERFELTQDHGFASRQRLALRDLADTARLARLTWVLAWLDIRLRYRGSMLGPFWLTLSTAAMVASMGFVYATLFGMQLHEYMPFLALSLVLWGFMSSLVTEGCTAFTLAEGLIRSVRMPFGLHAGRLVLRNLVVLAHNIVVIVAVFAVLDAWPGRRAVLALPGLALWLVDGFMLTLCLGALCSRFRDIPPIVASIMQMAFFISAVIWKPEQVQHWLWLMHLNPFFALLEVVRAPLLNEIPAATVYVAALVYSAILCGVSWLFFARVRGRIAFWV